MGLSIGGEQFLLELHAEIDPVEAIEMELPDAVKNVLKISYLKQLARPLGIRKIDIGEKGGRIFFEAGANIDPGQIIRLIQSDPAAYRLDGQDKLRINKELPDLESRLQILEFLFDEIALKNAA